MNGENQHYFQNTSVSINAKKVTGCMVALALHYYAIAVTKL